MLNTDPLTLTFVGAIIAWFVIYVVVIEPRLDDHDHK